MRSREEIEKESRESSIEIARSGMIYERGNLVLEVLLDIRDAVTKK